MFGLIMQINEKIQVIICILCIFVVYSVLPVCTFFHIVVCIFMHIVHIYFVWGSGDGVVAISRT